MSDQTVHITILVVCVVSSLCAMQCVCAYVCMCVCVVGGEGGGGGGGGGGSEKEEFWKRRCLWVKESTAVLVDLPAVNPKIHVCLDP